MMRTSARAPAHCALLLLLVFQEIIVLGTLRAQRSVLVGCSIVKG